MKKLILLTTLVGLVLMFNACSPAYVRTIPAEYNVVRPSSPSSTHIWVNDSWTWNRRTKSYRHNNGYWAMPNRGRSYQQGHWRTTRRGHQWVRGRWQ